MNTKKILPAAKRPLLGVLYAAAVVAICTILTAPAGADYQISDFTIDAGGGESAGGSYVVFGTIAQYDAGYSAGGDYEMFGGFWPAEPGCVVNFVDFAKFAEYWLDTGSGLPADLNNDSVVNGLDLEQLLADWLYYCPLNWKL